LPVWWAMERSQEVNEHKKQQQLAAVSAPNKSIIISFNCWTPLIGE